MPWWLWIVVGAVLFGSELLLPMDFYLVFLGASAMGVGLLALLGLDHPQWLQWALFAVFAVIGLVGFRGRLRNRLAHGSGSTGADDTLEGEVAIPRQALAPGAVGPAELRGTVWSAKNVDAAEIAAGVRTRVVRVDGLTLHVRRESEQAKE